MGLAGMHTGGKGIQPPHPMGKALIHKEFQGAIGNGRLMAKPLCRQTLQDIIGAKRLMLFQKDLQSPLAHRGKPRPLLGRQSFSPRQNIGGTMAMVMALKGRRRIGAACTGLWMMRMSHKDTLTRYDITFIPSPSNSRGSVMRYIISFLLTSVAIPASAEGLKVVTDMPPVHSITAAVMGDLGTPTLLLDQGASPHGFQLRPSQMSAVSEADLVIWIGPELSPWLEKALANRSAEAPSMPLLATQGTHLQDYGSADEPAAHDQDHDHSHDHDHEGETAEDHAAHAEDHDHSGHSHQGLDPHAWLDPGNGKIWTQAIAEELSRLDPENAATYAANAAASIAAITAAEEEAKALLAPVKSRPLIAFHDAYGYFTGHFGLTMLGTISSGDAASPGARHLAELQAKAQSAACLFPEAQHDPAQLTQLAEATGANVGGALDPEGSTLTPGPDLYPEMIRKLAQTIAACES